MLSVVLFALGWRWMPEKRRRNYAYVGFIAFALLAVAIAGCGGGGGGGVKTLNIKATYAGDTNYATSTVNAQIPFNKINGAVKKQAALRDCGAPFVLECGLVSQV